MKTVRPGAGSSINGKRNNVNIKKRIERLEAQAERISGTPGIEVDLVAEAWAGSYEPAALRSIIGICRGKRVTNWPTNFKPHLSTTKQTGPSINGHPSTPGTLGKKVRANRRTDPIDPFALARSGELSAGDIRYLAAYFRGGRAYVNEAEELEAAGKGRFEQ